LGCHGAGMFYYQFHIGDYRAATAHLSNDEDLAYRRLLDMYYDTEKPIPNDLAWLERRIRISGSVIRDVLNDMFQVTPDGYRNARADAEIANYHAFVEKQKSNGKKGGRPPLTHKEPTENPPVSQSEPKKSLTNNQQPLTINQDTPKPPKGADGRFEAFWKAYPKKIGKDAAHKAFEKRKPNDALVTQMIRAIRVQCESDAWKKDGGQFIPHPATWLNQGRWQDETQVDAPAQQSLETRQGVEELALKLGRERWSQTIPFGAYRAEIVNLARERGMI